MQFPRFMMVWNDGTAPIKREVTRIMNGLYLVKAGFRPSEYYVFNYAKELEITLDNPIYPPYLCIN